MKLHVSRARVATVAALLALGVPPAAGAQSDTAKARVPVTKERGVSAGTPAVTPVAKGAPTQQPIAKEPIAKEPTADAGRVSKGEVMQQAVTPVPSAPTTAVPGRPAGMQVPAPSPGAAPSQKTQQPDFLFGRSGFYVGLAAGTAVPYNVLSDIGYDSGLDLTIPIGWRRPGRLLGLRATLSFDQLHADANGPLPALLRSGPDPKIYAGTVDAVFSLPVGDARDGKGMTFYAVTGGGAYLFRGFGGTSELGDFLGSDEVGDSQKNVHKWGVQAGAGMEWGFGPTAVFVEGRWVNVFTNGSRAGNDYVRWVPIVVGVSLR